MSISKLVDVTVPAHSTNYTVGRQGNKITEIIIHHMAGCLTAQKCGQIFQTIGRNGSAHYGVGVNGEIGSYVDENDTAWHASNWEANLRSVGIETANSSTGGDWPVSDTTLKSLIKLVADIAKRNGLGKLVKGQNLKWHSYYAATQCPGDYLRSKLDYIVDQANEINYPTIKADVTKGEISGYRRERYANELIVYDMGSKTGTNNWGIEVRVNEDNVVLEEPHTEGNTNIPTKGRVISGHGKAKTWIMENIGKNGIAKIIKGDDKHPDKIVAYKTANGQISGYDTTRWTNDLIVYSSGSTNTNDWGIEVAINKNGIAIENPHTKGNTTVPIGGFVVSGHKYAKEWIESNIHKGDKVVVNNGWIKVTPRSKYDVNADGQVDTRDLVAEMKAVAQGVDDLVFDVNGDGEVNTKDLIKLQKYIAK